MALFVVPPDTNGTPNAAGVPKVKLVDLGTLHASIAGELSAAFADVLESSDFSDGRHVAEFEATFAAMHGVRAAAACGSGTDALTLALRAACIGPGDEVIVPALTFVATAEAVLHAGARPVIADVDPTTLLLTDAGVSEVRTRHTRAVIPVHLYGHAVSADEIQGWRRSGLTVIEDCAQAHLASSNGAPVGGAGDAACFSFYPGKNLGALGDGGLVASSDEMLLARVRRLRDHGQSQRYVHEELGWCSRLGGMQAAFLSVKLGHLPAWTRTRVALADRYREKLGDRLVPWDAGAVHHLLVARVSAREELRGHLEARGIETGLHYPVALSRQPALARWARSCPVAEQAAREVVSLPMHPMLELDDVDRVREAFLESEAFLERDSRNPGPVSADEPTGTPRPALGARRA